MKAQAGSSTMRKQELQPRPNTPQEQPHDLDREERQPYAKELDDYAHGVANPPQEQIGSRPPPSPTANLGNDRRGGRGDRDRRGQEPISSAVVLSRSDNSPAEMLSPPASVLPSADPSRPRSSVAFCDRDCSAALRVAFVPPPAGDEMTLLIEAAMDLGMNSGELSTGARSARRWQKKPKARNSTNTVMVIAKVDKVVPLRPTADLRTTRARSLRRTRARPTRRPLRACL